MKYILEFVICLIAAAMMYFILGEDYHIVEYLFGIATGTILMKIDMDY